MMHRNIEDLLHRKNVVSLPSEASVRAAACEMRARHVASVVVTGPDDQRLEGIFTERDLTERVVAGGLDPDRTRLVDVMTPHPITVGPDTPVGEALRHMYTNGLRHLPVVRNGEVLGVISMRDFMGDELASFDREREVMETLVEVVM